MYILINKKTQLPLTKNITGNEYEVIASYVLTWDSTEKWKAYIKLNKLRKSDWIITEIGGTHEIE